MLIIVYTAFCISQNGNRYKLSSTTIAGNETTTQGICSDADDDRST